MIVATAETMEATTVAQSQVLGAKFAATRALVTAATTAERVRFAAPNAVVQMRLEVYAETGQKVLDTEQRGGSVLDWHLQGSAGERVSEGSYLCVLTVKSLSGRLIQKLGTVKVGTEGAVVEAITAAQINGAQAQAVGPVEGDVALIVLPEDAIEIATVLTHNGRDGQLSRTRGALMFRVGNLFTGTDREQMRLTEDGKLGIGTTKPEATLDVLGTIRASKGVEFADGTVQTTGLSGRKDKLGNIMPAVAGTGTTNQVTKWTDNAGTLGDSTITEVSGRVGIGITNPSYKLVVGPDIGPGLTTSDLTVSRGAGQSISIFAGATGAHGMNFGWDEGNLRAFVNAPVQSPITFTHGGVNERMRIETNGNVGIGTPNPTSLLDVAGNINTSTQFNIGGSRMLSVAGFKNLYAGVSTGPNIVTAGSCCNAFFGTLTGTANTTGKGNSFFGDEVGSANTTGSDNSFFGLGSGIKNTSGSDNSFFGSQAGPANVGASGNSFFGSGAGNHSTGSSNSFFGSSAGFSNTIASQNSFFGEEAGASNTTAINNSFFGYQAGRANTANASNNSFFGSLAGLSNTASQNSFFGEEAGTLNTTAGNNSFFGFQAGKANTTNAANNSFFGSFAGTSNTNGANNSFFGEGAGAANTTGTNNSSLGVHADVKDGLNNATAIGFRSFVEQSNSLVLGSINGVNGAGADTNIGIGTSTPAKHLHIFGAGDQEIGIESSDSGGRQWTLQSSRGSSPFSGEFQIIDRTAGASRFSILGNGNVGIGTTAPGNTLQVLGGANGVAFAENHLVLIENTSPGFGIGTNTLALKIDKPGNPDSQDNFITFIKASGESAGSVEGNGSGGISFGGIGNDYAEWLPRLNSAEKIQPGEIVGLYGGRITKNTRGAAQVMAVSTGPIVAGNDPGKDARDKYALVAFIGQVMTRVRGSVQAGDFIVASDLNDGTGVAVSPANITAEQFEQVVGQAWETSGDAGLKSVRVAVGLIRRDPTVRRLLEYNRRQADRIGALDARLTTLEAQLTSKTARTSRLPVTRKKHRLVARLADVGTPRSARTSTGK